MSKTRVKKRLEVKCAGSHLPLNGQTICVHCGDDKASLIAMSNSPLMPLHFVWKDREIIDGQRIFWCETHLANGPRNPGACWYFNYVSSSEGTPCLMVEKLLVGVEQTGRPK